MEAANARIGVARSAMFPALSIGANGGGVAGTFADVFKWSSRSWLLGAALAMPLIDGGRNRSNVVRSEAALEEAVGSYRQSVLVAFAEVEDNLAGLRVLAGQGAEIEAAVVSARRSADLAQKLYDAGRCELPGPAGCPAQPGDRGAHRGAAARRPRGHHGGADPRAGRRLGCGAVRPRDRKHTWRWPANDLS